MRSSEFVLLLLLMIFSTSCIFNSDNDDENDFIYPLSIGNIWEYKRQWNLYYYSDSLEIKEYTDTVTYSSDISVSITDEVTLNGDIDTYKMTGIENDGMMTFEGTQYYRNNEDGLYIYAYLGSGVYLPKDVAGEYICFKGKKFKNFHALSNYIQEITPILSLQSDTIIYEEPPIKTIHYPIKIGKQWTYREAGNPWRMDRKVTNRVNLEIEIGSFDCYTIKFIYDLDEDGEWDDDIWITDYISKQGLIKREIYVMELLESTVTHPEGTGRKFDAFDEYTLTDYIQQESN